jgi:hypothetical protein
LLRTHYATFDIAVGVRKVFHSKFWAVRGVEIASDRCRSIELDAKSNESRENEYGPQKNDIATWIVEIRAGQANCKRSCKNGDRAELERPENIHVDCA